VAEYACSVNRPARINGVMESVPPRVTHFVSEERGDRVAKNHQFKMGVVNPHNIRSPDTTAARGPQLSCRRREIRGGGGLARRSRPSFAPPETPLTRRLLVYFASGAYTSGRSYFERVA
jgi:hypothetical protein